MKINPIQNLNFTALKIKGGHDWQKKQFEENFDNSATLKKMAKDYDVIIKLDKCISYYGDPGLGSGWQGVYQKGGFKIKEANKLFAKTLASKNYYNEFEYPDYYRTDERASSSTVSRYSSIVGQMNINEILMGLDEQANCLGIKAEITKNKIAAAKRKETIAKKKAEAEKAKQSESVKQAESVKQSESVKQAETSSASNTFDVSEDSTEVPFVCL